MSYSPQKGDVEVSLSVFGGLVSDTPAASLPEGVSPDCSDVVFSPGSVRSRPALQKVFSPAFPSGGPHGYVPTITYAKTFVTLTGGIENLYLDSNGVLYWEDVINSPGTLTSIGNFTPGSWAKSTTAFGKEYIAISDQLHGSDIPLQWDGTNLDRVTQDGPGAAPNVASLVIPSVGMAASGAVSVTPSELDATGLTGGFYTGINLFTSSSVAAINPGDSLTIGGCTGGHAAFNGTYTVLAVYTGGTNLIQLSAYLPSSVSTPDTTDTMTGTIQTGSMVRQGNVVTVTTSAAHQLQVGYQAQISGVPAQAVGGGISQIKIVNEDNPGIATVTTNSAHGLLPGIFVSISGVTATAVGGGIASMARAGQLVTVTTNSAHDLTPGAVVTLAGNTPTSFNTTATVLNVVSSTVFTFIQVDVDASATAFGTVSINWPIPDSATPTYFEVLAAPTTTTFQVSVNYSDGTWSSGAVTYAWDGTFFVTAVPTTTSFQYQQYGPNASTNSTAGSVTPYGQAAPGVHQCRVTFLTRQGAITRPSPPIKFVASGGQYITVTNIPIGPSNVVARILEFTGASGSSFFYIPSTPQVNGLVVGTATQINDNTTTAVTLDFSDPTLFAATATSIPGNNLAAQNILDGALGFGLYASRLVTWGQRNMIQNFLNMGFDGGYLPSANTLPAGWTASGGALAAGHWGKGWQASGAGSLVQSAYQDAYGAPILTEATKYTLRAWVKGNGTSLTATISSSSAGFSSTATVSGTTNGAFAQADFNNAAPSPIPADMILTLTWTGTPLIDEVEILYQSNPFTDTLMYMSYVDNPEAFDGVTGKIGSTKDQHKVMDMADIRDTGYFLTQDPSGRLHQFRDNGVTEPSGWTVSQVAANCGVLSAWGLTKSQADDSSAAGGEEWFAWCSYTGARIFGGDQPWKISQEIEPTWNGLVQQASTLGLQSYWSLNDPDQRILYFGMTSGNAPDIVYAMSYRQLDSAYAIGNTGPIRIGFSGKLIATDHARKWSRWNVEANGAALMQRGGGQIEPVFLGGNGQVPGTAAGFGNVYVLNYTQTTDDDYGQIVPYWVTSFLPSHDTEEAVQIAGYRKLLVYVISYATGLAGCFLKFTPYADQLTNAWPITATRTLAASPAYDIEFGGCSAQGNRIALRIASLPNQPGTGSATDNSFNLQRLTMIFRKHPMQIRGAA